MSTARRTPYQNRLTEGVYSSPVGSQSSEAGPLARVRWLLRPAMMSAKLGAIATWLAWTNRDLTLGNGRAPV